MRFKVNCDVSRRTAGGAVPRTERVAMVPDPAVLFALFVALPFLKLGVAGYLYFAYGEEYFSKCGDQGKEAEAEAQNAVVVKGFATGESSPAPRHDAAAISKKGSTTEDEHKARLMSLRVRELKKLS